MTAGDTLWDIADTTYGDPSEWPEIFDVNLDVIDDPDLILPGQVLAIPDLVPTSSNATHLVVEGESLWAIADLVYGDPTRWADIFAANRDLITDPNRIAIGDLLSIP